VPTKCYQLWRHHAPRIVAAVKQQLQANANEKHDEQYCSLAARQKAFQFTVIRRPQNISPSTLKNATLFSISFEADRHHDVTSAISAIFR
jgi:hypothetical protein